MKLRNWDRNLKIRLGGEALVNITFWMFFPFLTIFFSEAFGKTTAGFLLIFSQIFSVIANLLGGYCADRYGRKRMMVLSSSCQALAFFAFAYASSPWLDSPTLAFICFSLVSVCGSLYWPASQAMVADVVDEKNRSSVFAVFYTSINIAVVIGPIIGGLFYAEHRFELLLLAGIMNATLALILQKKIEETAPTLIGSHTTNGSSKTGLEFLVDQIKTYKIIIQDKVFLLFILAGIIGGMTFMQLDLLFPVYTKEVIHNQTLLSMGKWEIKIGGEQAFGLLISENGLLVAIFTIAVTKWMGLYKERNVFVVSSIIYGFSMLVAASTGWIWGLILAMALFTFGELMTVGIQQGFISKIAPEHMRGQYFAAASLRFTIGRMIAPIAIPMSSWFGNSTTFIILFFFCLISAFLYYLMYSLHEKKNQAVTITP
ncbi:MDR family MFS transporter [Peribacillus alkalitolerans]|uniref:MDR family MFS transporter n=1 Tax=Peribacillus alkalitolerans TaxID=1550385 RepID=UPI0013D1281D|nr:MFS transporter [Peribacillus alkalitolerans]